MPWSNPVGEQIFQDKYALKDENGKPVETFDQACDRVAQFASKTDKQKEQLSRLLKERKIVPAGRWWYAAGRGYPQINNCFVIPTDVELGKFCHDLCITLMTGGGVGANYSSVEHPKPRKGSLPTYPEIYLSKNHPDYTVVKEKYSHLIKPNPVDEDGNEIKVGYPVKDSRDGWGVAVLKAGTGISNCEEVVLNLSDIRPRGSLVKGFGGIAAGPDALLIMIDGIFNVIMRSYLKSRTLGPIDWMKIANYIARGVSSAGIRRSAMMGMLHWKHESIDRFITCKDNDGDLEIMNVSIVIDNTFVKQASSKNTRASKIYEKAIKHACTHGEPGFWNIELSREEVPDAIATNPCGEQSLPPYGNCNLGHINLAAHGTKQEIIESALVLTEMLINGTLVSKFPLPEFYVRVDKDRRIGVGILGLHSWLVQRGKPFKIDKQDEKFFKQLYTKIREHADRYATRLRINKPETVTTVAPTGTISFLAGVTTGIEPMFCAAYQRRFVEAKVETQTIIDPLAKECIEKGIPVDDAFSLTPKQHLDIQVKIQRSFVDNSVSKTINLPQVGTFNIKRVARDVLDALEKGVKGVTVYPNGARGNQPIIPVSLDEALKAQQTKTQMTEKECSTGTCEL
jgi:ribonucleoside-triphosphate reductase